MLSLPTSDDPKTYAIIGAAIEVHRVLGAGFLEIFYKDALAIELALRKIPFQARASNLDRIQGQANPW